MIAPYYYAEKNYMRLLHFFQLKKKIEIGKVKNDISEGPQYIEKLFLGNLIYRDISPIRPIRSIKSAERLFYRTNL